MMPGGPANYPWLPSWAAENFGIAIALFSLLAIWSAIWKGMALWRAGRSGHLVWFVVLFLVNTLGILEILYLFVFSKKMKK